MGDLWDLLEFRPIVLGARTFRFSVHISDHTAPDKSSGGLSEESAGLQTQTLAAGAASAAAPSSVLYNTNDPDQAASAESSHLP